jgi:hypothetical protein
MRVPHVLLSAPLVALVALTASAAPPGLGEPFPGPLLATAVRGRMPNVREPGSVAVVAFVRTSEALSRQALPALAAAADRFGAKVAVVAVSDEPVSILRDFTVSPEWTDRISFTVAADPTRNAFQTVFGQNAFPELPAIFVLRGGKVQWRGAPEDLAPALASVIEGTWDVEAAKRAAEQARLWDAQMDRIESMAKSGRTDEALAALDESCRSALPAQQATCSGRRFSMLLDARRVADALKVGEEILASPANPKQPAGIAWALANAVPGDKAALAFALKAAEASDRALSGKDAMVGAILARVQFLSGDRARAADTARRALRTADSPDVRKALEEDLRVYGG